MSGWTAERIAETWQAVRLELAASGDPTAILRRRFRKGIDAASLPKATAEEIARLWLVWGVFTGARSLWTVPPEREPLHQRALSILEDALRCNPSSVTAAEIHFNLGALHLASTLLPADPALHLAAQVGLLEVSQVDWLVQDGPASVRSWQRAATALERARGLQALPAADDFLLLCYCLQGAMGRSLPVRTRLLQLERARALTAAEPGHLRELAAAAHRRLDAASWLTRRLGKEHNPLPESAPLSPLRIASLFRLPAALLESSAV